MYDTLIAFHILDLIQKSLERISFRFSDISCPDDFLLSESGMMTPRYIHGPSGNR